ncbi:o-methyltransferase [Hirsutella rhossiliensis]|uniref:O-methyltransferase domain-containing protein n=1 Tax=Hirsutella rhossiliensis TaxID=111463 RepID=A0A9P8SIT9_9HYPO|nr:o-methyltransferase domain-containing protein [Hirsutella rhossiliensis]KAH0962975.1 o-methyltransferase domain-containing protein [Hirsutella rhossiliensis]
MANHGVKPVAQLLAQIQSNTSEYLAFFSAQGLPEPSFGAGDGLKQGQPLPASVQAARDAALEATDELHHLLLGPLALVVDCPGDHYLMLSLQYIFRHKLVRHVPLEGATTFDAVAQAAGLDVRDVTRFLRSAMTRHVFHERRKGSVEHTAASRVLVDDDSNGHSAAMVEAAGPAARSPASPAGYALGHGTRRDENPFDAIWRDAARQQRFIDAMTYSHRHASYSVEHLLQGFDFSGARTVVDVGGSHGQAAVALAAKYPSLERIVVQDLGETIVGLNDKVPGELRARVHGMAHDFLAPQPVRDADVYLLRWILHDWSDKYCVKILRALVPALKPGAKVVVNDICMPEPGQLGIAAERSLRLMDISMKAFNNARERDAETWAGLFAEADARFEFVGITVPEGASMAIIQAQWRPTAASVGDTEGNLGR